jgi:hypothetical protein
MALLTLVNWWEFTSIRLRWFRCIGAGGRGGAARLGDGRFGRTLGAGCRWRRGGRGRWYLAVGARDGRTPSGPATPSI